MSRNSDDPWKDEETLRELYCDEKLTQREIADKFGCTDGNISYWMDRFGIEARNVGTPGGERPWKDAEILRELYVERDMTSHEVADKLGCSHQAVLVGMREHDIERRTQGGGWRHIARFYTPTWGETAGYELWRDDLSAPNTRVRHHRLLAVAEYGFDAVKDMDVHHINGIKWDNRPENIALITRSEHARHHAHEQWANGGIR